MRSKKAEKQILRDADRIISMKEEMEAVSWGRVVDIAQQMQEAHTEDQRQDWARELITIARANTSVLDRFGVSSDTQTGLTTPSGIEINEDDHYLTVEDVNQPMTGTEAERERSDAVRAEAPERAFAGEDAAFRDYYDPFEDSSFFSEAVEEEKPSKKRMVIPRAKAKMESFAAKVMKEPASEEEAFRSEASDVSVVEAIGDEADLADAAFDATVKASHEDIAEAVAAEQTPLAEPMVSDGGSQEQMTEAEVAFHEEESSAPAAAVPPVAPPAPVVPPAPATANDADELISASIGEAAANTSSGIEDQITRKAKTVEAKAEMRKARRRNQDLANFRQIYESRDGGMSLYEDADGHLVAIDPRRLV